MDFSSSFYKNNRDALKKIANDSLILIAGNSLMQRSADTHFAFRQESNVIYTSGISEPNVCILLNPKTNEEFIMIDEKQDTAKIFDGVHDASQMITKSGIKNIITVADGIKYISKYAGKHSILFNDVATGSKVDFTRNDFRAKIKRRLQAKKIKTTAVQPLLARLRSVKQLPEIQAIQKAVQITNGALQEAELVINNIQNEHELKQIIDKYFIDASVEHAYAPIIAAGNNANTLHYIANNKIISSGDAILFDVGAEVSGYAADISRTYIKGRNKRAQQIIAAVQQVQTNLINYVAPGITWKELTNKTLDETSNALKKLGIIHTSEEVRGYMPHAIGHFLGLDVHDMGDYTEPLAENMVLTIEPGLYLPDEKIGVRIEDDVIVTKVGAKILK